MKQLLFLLLLFLTALAFGQRKTVFIKNHAFTFKTVFEETEYTDEPIKKVHVYRGNKKLLTHTISEVWGDCNSESLQFGTYEITDSTITFYSYWARAGDAPTSPFGSRKQVYNVSESGAFIMQKSELYVETSRQGWQENKGIEYLFTGPKNAKERKLLLKYIREAEKEYHARFVFGRKYDELMKEVRSKFSKEIAAETQYWGQSGPHTTFGFKK